MGWTGQFCETDETPILHSAVINEQCIINIKLELIFQQVLLCHINNLSNSAAASVSANVTSTLLYYCMNTWMYIQVYY